MQMRTNGQMDFGIVDMSGSGDDYVPESVIDWKRILGLGSSLATHLNKVSKDRDMSVKKRKVIGLLAQEKLPINACALEG